MTIQMTIALAIVILMIVAIMTDKLAFGAPALIACVLLVLTGISPVEEAFAGFIDTNVVMIAGFMAVMAALQKTNLMNMIKTVMGRFANKGGFKSYVMLLIIVMLGASLLSGTTGYYVMILSIVASIPYNKNLPNSKLLMPLGFGTGRALIPVSVAFFMGLANSLLDGAYVIELPRFAGMIAFMSVAFLIWCLIAYRILPDYDISGGANDTTVEKKEEEKGAELPRWKEIVVYIAFFASVIGMIFASKLGTFAYILPCFATVVLGLIKVMDFKEIRNNIFSPLIIMMASVIGVANALASTGFTPMIGELVAKAMGGTVNPFVLTLAFCLLTSACSTLTGSSVGSVFIFAPIAIATCTSLGLNPMGLAAAITVSAWGGGFLPIDGLPAMILGMGKYKLSQFFKFALPMYLIQIIGLVIGSLVMFPM